MNQDYIPILALVFIIPLFISPITIQGFEAEEGTIHVLVEFEYPKNIEGLTTDINAQIMGNLTQVQTDFIISGNFTSSSSQLSDLDEMLFDLGTNVNGTNIYQLSTEIWYTGDSPLTQTEINVEHDIAVSSLRNIVIDFLQNNNGVHVMSWIEFTSAEVTLDEQF